MKKFLFSILTIAALIGCGKDDNNSDAPAYSAEEAKTEVKATMDNFYECLKKANDGGFANFFYNTITKAPGQNQAWFGKLADKFEDQHQGLFTALDDNKRFDFNSFKGTYTWSNVTNSWTKEANTAKIVLIFPATATSTTNNARAEIDNYQDELVMNQDNENVYLPKKAHLFISVDNTKQLEVTLRNVECKKLGEGFTPTAIDLAIFTNPFTTTIKFAKKEPTIYTLNFNFSSPQGCATGLAGSIKLTSDNLDSFTSFEEAVESINVVAFQDKFQVIANVDVKSVHKAGKKLADLEGAELNTYFKAELYKNNRKVADVKVEEDNRGDSDLFFIFSDGSKQRAESYIEDFEEKVENIFKRFFKD